MPRAGFPSRCRDTARDPPRVEAVVLASAESSARGGRTATAARSSFMTVVLFDEHRAGEPDQRGVVGEDADDVGVAADLAVDALQRVGGAQLFPVVGGE